MTKREINTTSTSTAAVVTATNAATTTATASGKQHELPLWEEMKEGSPLRARGGGGRGGRRIGVGGGRRKKKMENEEGEEEDGVDWGMTEKLSERMMKQMQKVEEEEEEEEQRQKRKRKLSDAEEGDDGKGEKEESRSTMKEEEEKEEVEFGDDEMNSLLEELGDGGRLCADAIVQRSSSKGRERGGEVEEGRGGGDYVEEEEDVVMEEDKQEEEDEEMRGVSQLYVHLGEFLKRYRSGRVPKALKMLPRLRQWEQLLYKTNPTEWSATAMFAATRIFASNFNAKMAQRFFNLVLLPNVREDIAENRRLNYHLYQALTRAMFKPAAWFKGILLPLVMEGCSLREIVIVGSVLSRMSIPVLHSAAALVKLSQRKSTDTAVAYVMNLLLAKKYSLPLKVIAMLVDYFGHFVKDANATLAVIWHKCLLTLVQKYKCDLTGAQRETVLALVRVHSHHLITAEIRRELSATMTSVTKRRRIARD
eukprot:GHVS01095402.1.p1 GENE.GHVS01095402.1~~GHVS01095402.1.p1  ORF type:complete len:479 (+),score=169.98 GHVS01095402.1:249-1685(+)